MVLLLVVVVVVVDSKKAPLAGQLDVVDPSRPLYSNHLLLIVSAISLPACQFP